MDFNPNQAGSESSKGLTVVYLLKFIVFTLLFSIVFSIPNSFILGFLFGSIASDLGVAGFLYLLITVLMGAWAARVVLNKGVNNTSKPETQGSRFTRKLLAVFTVIGGLIAGATLGLVISFSACFKSECSAIEGSAMITLPIASLFFTIPTAKKLYKDDHKNNTQSAENVKPPSAEDSRKK